jgi:hypothetical protein
VLEDELLQEQEGALVEHVLANLRASRQAGRESNRLSIARARMYTWIEDGLHAIATPSA